jgi:hypothetical protein
MDIGPPIIQMVVVDVGDDGQGRAPISKTTRRTRRLRRPNNPPAPPARPSPNCACARPPPRWGPTLPPARPGRSTTWWWFFRECRPTAMVYFSRASSANISMRGMTGIFCAWASTTSGLSGRTAVEVTTTCTPRTCSARWPMTPGPPWPSNAASRRFLSRRIRSRHIRE